MFLRLHAIEHLKRSGSYKKWCSIASNYSHWSPEYFRMYCDNMLRQIGKRAANAQYYVDRNYASALQNLNRKNITDLPFLAKEAIRESPERFLPNGRRGMSRRASTGGTSGSPLMLYQSLLGLQAEQAFIDHLWSCVGFQPSSRLLVLRGGHAGASPIRTKHRLVLPAKAAASESTDEIVGNIARFRPEYLHCYPSTALSLARQLGSEFSRSLGLRGVLCGSETIYDHQIDFLESAFNCPVVCWYGHSEQGAFAVREPDGAYSFNPAYGHVELVEQESGLYEIVTTGWLNGAMPLIRYRTKDYVKNFEWKKINGILVLRVERILGREQEMILNRRGRTIPFNHFVFGMHGPIWRNVADFQFVQNVPGELSLQVLVVPEADREKTVAALAEAFSKRFQEHVHLKVVPTDSFLRSGKKKQYFVSNLHENKTIAS